jgi:hypothetical protein
MTPKKKCLLVILVPTIIYGIYAHAGTATIAFKQLKEAGYSLYKGLPSFSEVLETTFINSKSSWTESIIRKKSEVLQVVQILEQNVGTIETGIQNELGDRVKSILKEKKNNIQYILSENEQNTIQTSLENAEAEAQGQEFTNALETKQFITKTAISNAEKTATRKLNKTATFPVTIQTDPADATVRIMNIKPRYKDGIMLRKGRYDIEVSFTGYRSQRLWIDLDPLFNTLRIELNKKGSLPCDEYTISKSGNMLQPYGSQVLVVDYLDDVTVSEIYFSMLEHIASRNYIEYYKADISENYAYFSYVFGFLDRDEIKENQRIVAKPDRFNQAFIGIEQVKDENKVKLITHVEVPQYAIPYGIEEVYCESLKAI